MGQYASSLLTELNMSSSMSSDKLQQRTVTTSGRGPKSPQDHFNYSILPYQTD